MTVKLRLAVGTAFLFVGVAGLLAAAPAEAGLGKSSAGAIQVSRSRETPAPMKGLALDPKCMKAFDTVMDPCDGKDIGPQDDQADAADNANADADQGRDDGDGYADSQLDEPTLDIA